MSEVVATFCTTDGCLHQLRQFDFDRFRPRVVHGGFRRLKAYKHLHVLRAALQPINQLAVCRRILSSVGTAFALRYPQVKSSVSRTFASFPGMPAEVFIRTHERTPLHYLLKPLQEQVARTFRER